MKYISAHDSCMIPKGGDIEEYGRNKNKDNKNSVKWSKKIDGEKSKWNKINKMRKLIDKSENK